jgi:hypothetical protein
VLMPCRRERRSDMVATVVLIGQVRLINRTIKNSLGLRRGAQAVDLARIRADVYLSAP